MTTAVGASLEINPRISSSASPARGVWATTKALQAIGYYLNGALPTTTGDPRRGAQDAYVD